MQGSSSPSARPRAQEPPVVSALQAVLPARLLRAAPGHGGGAFGAAWERSGARLATAGADRTVKLWDAEGHHVITLQAWAQSLGLMGIRRLLSYLQAPRVIGVPANRAP
jgi:WD40 repeat protein